MRNFIMIGVVAITIPFLNVPPLSADSFVEKMKPYVGRALSADEVRQVFVGNTLYRSKERKRGYVDIFWYFQSRTKVDITKGNRGPIPTPWSIKQKNGEWEYWHKSISLQGAKFSRRNVRLSIEDGKMMVTFFDKPKKDKTRKRKDRIMQLLQGKHDEAPPE